MEGKVGGHQSPIGSGHLKGIIPAGEIRVDLIDKTVVGTGMKMARSAGLAIRAYLHIPEEGFTQSHDRGTSLIRRFPLFRIQEIAQIDRLRRRNFF